MPNPIESHLTQAYWDKLLAENSDLKAVGWPNWPESYNLILYKKYLKGFSEVIKDVNTHIKINNENLKVLEVGCGTGFYTTYLQHIGVKNYTGVDISEISITKLKSKFTNYIFLKNNISEETDFIKNNTGKFDVVIIIDVLLHITEDERFKSSLKNIATILKNGGLLIIGDNFTVYRTKNHSEGSKYTHDVSRHVNYVTSLLEKQNIKLIKIYHRKNFLLNNNFDFKYPFFEYSNKIFFFLLNGFLSVFRSNEFVGKLIGYPLSFLDNFIVPFQKYSKNSKFFLFKKNEV